MPNYAAIRDNAELDEIVDRLIREGKTVAYDIEAGYTGPDAKNISTLEYHPNWILVGISFTNSVEWARYVPIAHDDANNIADVQAAARAFWKLLNNTTTLAHNAKYELTGISRWFRETLWDDPYVGEEVRKTNGHYPNEFDSMIEVFISCEYDPIRVGKGLKPVALEAFGLEMDHFPDLFPVEDSELGPGTPKGKKSMIRFNTRYSTSSRIIAYACEDSVASLMVHEKHWPKIQADKRDMFIYKLEISLTPVLVQMEDNGLYLDWDEFKRKDEELLEFKELFTEEIMSELSKRLGRVVSINLGSPKQLATLLFGEQPENLGLPVREVTKAGNPSTGEPALRQIAQVDPVVKKILLWKQMNKLHGSYLKKYAGELNYDPEGKGRGNHNQVGALTGRLSVDGVSYQQWPKPYFYTLDNSDRIFEFGFKEQLFAPEGYRVMGFDFSQMELRLLAGYAQETTLLKAFADGVDPHKATAAAMFGIPVSEVDKKKRQIGKTLNFSVVYQTGAETVANQISTPEHPVSKEEAQGHIDAYYNTYSNLRAWMDGQIVEGKETGMVYTYFGRRFKIWEYESRDPYIRSKGDRMCINAPVQGASADIAKLGIVRAQKAIDDHGLHDKIKLFATVHDALEMYVHNSLSDQEVIDLLQDRVALKLPGFPEFYAEWHVGPRYGTVAVIELDENKKITGYTPEGSDTTYEDRDLAIAEVIRLENEVHETRVREQHEKVTGVKVEEEPVVEELPEPKYLDEVEINIDHLPTKSEWHKFGEWLKSRTGPTIVNVVTPKGDLTLNHTYGILPEDQNEVSLILGGASLNRVTKIATTEFLESLDD